MTTDETKIAVLVEQMEQLTRQLKETEERVNDRVDKSETRLTLRLVALEKKSWLFAFGMVAAGFSALSAIVLDRMR